MQVGLRDHLPKLVRQFNLAADPATWANTCLLLLADYRGQGLAHGFLQAVLQDLRGRGVRHVQAFPRRGTGLSAGQVWNGPEAIFKQASFTVEFDDPRRPIYGLWL